MLVAILFLLQPFIPVVEDRVCVHERNHFYDAQGKLIFVQNIFWDEDAEVIAWRMQKRDTWQVSKNNHIFMDHDFLRRIRSVSFIETFTQFDPELEARNFVPVEMRKELSVK